MAMEPAAPPSVRWAPPTTTNQALQILGTLPSTGCRPWCLPLDLSWEDSPQPLAQAPLHAPLHQKTLSICGCIIGGGRGNSFLPLVFRAF